MMPDPDRMRDVLGRPELRRFVHRLRARRESGRTLTGTMTLTACQPEERDALNRLLRRAPATGQSVTIPLETLENSLRQAGVCDNLHQAIEYLTGPVVDKRAERLREKRTWSDLFVDAKSRIIDRKELLPWLEQIQFLGLLKRHGIDRAVRLLDDCFKVLAALPAQGIPLAELAASVLGDAHALDSGRAHSSILLRAISCLQGVECSDDSEGRRDAWASVGVLLDELSAPIAVLNLRASGGDPTSRSLNHHAESAEPCFLTIRQLVRTPPSFDRNTTGPIVYIFENKNVLAAAACRLGKQSPPLIATDGQPKTSLHLLLKQLTEEGIRLRYHGDFDWSGIRIANLIINRHGAVAWKMTSGDYDASVSGNLALIGPPVDASWDETLRQTMKERGVALHEEQVLDTILTALSSNQ